ncbi:MAG: hypothetical protein LUG60_01010 [Erysipelotrichaceae bacterium]|nr:hypothetical protein [Erysipelotrichaceae bacterium]
MISFDEYVYNVLKQLIKIDNKDTSNSNIDLLLSYIENLIEELNYMIINKQNIFTFVPKNPATMEVAKIVSEELSDDIFSYNHHSLKGNLKEKSNILHNIAFDLEPRRDKLKKINNKFCNNLFFCFNNLNIRHNNKDKNDTSKYFKCLDEISNDDLEELYDQTYDMCLIAYLMLENPEWDKRINNLKENRNK